MRETNDNSGKAAGNAPGSIAKRGTRGMNEVIMKMNELK